MTVYAPEFISITNDGNGTSFTVRAKSSALGTYEGMLFFALGQRDKDLVYAAVTPVQSAEVNIVVAGCISGQQYIGYLLTYDTVNSINFFGLTLPSFALYAAPGQSATPKGIFVTTQTQTIRKKILTAVDTALKTISTANGFQTDVRQWHNHRPVNPDFNTDRAELYYWDEVGAGNDLVNGGYQYKAMKLIVGCCVMGGPDDDQDNMADLLAADVEAALLPEGMIWGDSAYAEYASLDRWEPETYLGENDPRASIWLTFNIEYEHLFANPLS